MKILRLYLLTSFKHFKLKNSVFRLYSLLKLSYLYKILNVIFRTIRVIKK